MGTTEAKFISIKGIQIAYYDLGAPKAGTILFLHGWAGSKDFFQDIFPILTANYRLIIPDFPGHNDSETTSFVNLDSFENTVEEFVEDLKLTNFHLICYSMGCLVGLKYLEKKQDTVNKYVNWAGLEKYSDIPQFRISGKIMDFLDTQEIFKEIYKDFLERGADILTNDRTYNGLKDADTETLAMLIEDLCRADLSYIPPMVANNTLVITGRKDDIHIDRERVKNLSKSFPNGRYVEVDGGEHYADDLKPAAEEIIKFLANE